MQIQRTQQDSKAFKATVSGMIRNPQGYTFNRTKALNLLKKEALKRGLVEEARDIVQERFLTKAKSLLGIVLYDKRFSSTSPMKSISGEIIGKGKIIWDA